MSILSIIGCGVAGFVVLMFGRGCYYGFLAKKYCFEIESVAATIMQRHLMGTISEQEVETQMDQAMTELFNGRHKGYQAAIVKEVMRRVPMAQMLAAQTMAMFNISDDDTIQ